ncbi:beta-1,3-galactosyltransferase GALT1 [Amborella trichopoda]|uniref:Galectin domain-containing protein n=1 Tax=Amborella trichopoda TaxID=13333 RepID=W1NH52_AMBTC|nr:beta-1,3-galactosyltransferase GALT1 [Amborella trichopoda]XP_020521910.1 beta-1,3-galactosyltransferase GALT1 [Amborella trichopoda]ERM94500.1 hypothetical protein AMTR_s00010p00262720 [Amborella trichopoda]|eukprot:XP_006827263.1 beta-1,3-galactosyltransferase GALT1 [Amborella trichopoda]
MKRWTGGFVICFLFICLVLMYSVTQTRLDSPSFLGFFSNHTTKQLHLENVEVKPIVQNSDGGIQVVSSDILVSSLFVKRNLSESELLSLQTWNRLKHLTSHAEALPHAMEAIKEAGVAWESLMVSAEKERLNGTDFRKSKEKQCPYSLSKMNSTELGGSEFKLQIPCGLIEGSSITIIGSPTGVLGNFKIDLTGAPLPGEPDPPIILHYNVRLQGDKLTENPVIVQNTWTVAHDWGAEERCPPPGSGNSGKVDDLDQCNPMVGKAEKRSFAIGKHSNVSERSHLAQKTAKKRLYFPFTLGFPFVATLRLGLEGIHMTVDGKHITSFAYRDSLEPWLVNEVRISGDLKLMSVLASGLPTSEDLEHVIDIDTLKATPLPPKKQLSLVVGVFSTANNFKRRMAVRRTWMQYDAVKSGAVAVRFFVGLHKNELVNMELWDEARTYGDTQLVPFVDYYSLITWKTIAICIYGTEVVSTKYVMKTDDDAFVRIDEILASLNSSGVTKGLLYGLINSDSKPHRNPESKWYISPEEYNEEAYPPWAHGPGYIVSRDVAASVVHRHKKGRLKLFKLEDVAMGIWIAELKKKGADIKYVNDKRIFNEGCEDGYVVAHYQGPRNMLCLWNKLQEGNRAKCCD